MNYQTTQATGIISDSGRLSFTFTLHPAKQDKKKVNHILECAKQQQKLKDEKTIENMASAGADGTQQMYLYSTKCEMTPEQIKEKVDGAGSIRRIERTLERYKNNSNLRHRAEREFMRQQFRDAEKEQEGGSDNEAHETREKESQGVEAIENKNKPNASLGIKYATN